MGKSTISMAMFNSYVKLPEGKYFGWYCIKCSSVKSFANPQKNEELTEIHTDTLSERVLSCSCLCQVVQQHFTIGMVEMTYTRSDTASTAKHVIAWHSHLKYANAKIYIVYQLIPYLYVQKNVGEHVNTTSVSLHVSREMCRQRRCPFFLTSLHVI